MIAWTMVPVGSSCVSAGASPLAELGVALHAYTEAEHHPRALRWVRGLDADAAARGRPWFPGNQHLGLAAQIGVVLKLCDGAWIRMGVHDGHPECPAPGDSGTEATHGRGLKIVHALLEELNGVVLTERTADGGKTVWVELACPLEEHTAAAEDERGGGGAPRERCAAWSAAAPTDTAYDRYDVVSTAEPRVPIDIAQG
ncbi:DUF5937 family protein [Streptomyces chartreusis]|uniref:DUF5937 family protein n=1 Tax=Streptomyces chartreusis TaxID=1969 RepID=UPI003625613D